MSTLQEVSNVSGWVAPRAVTNDGKSDSGRVRLAEAIVEHELSAYPEGLHFT